MKLVSDGEKWAVKRWSWFRLCYLYFDGYGIGGTFWWAKTSQYFNSCWTSKELAERAYRRLTS